MNLQIKQIPAMPIISRTDRVTIPRIPAHSGPAIHSLVDSLTRLDISLAAGDMIYIYHGCDGNPAVEFDLEICLPIPAGLTAKFDLPIRLTTAPAFRCLAFDYIGPMSGIGAAWMNLVAAVRSGAHQPTDQSREVYKKWVGFDSPENITELQQGIA